MKGFDINLKRHFRSSFSEKLSLLVILLSALLFLATISIVSVYSRKLIREEAIRNAFSTLKATTLEIDNVLQSVSVAIDNIADDVQEEALKGESGKQELFEITRRVVEQNQYIIGSDIAIEPYFFPKTNYFSPYSFKNDDTITTAQVGNDNYAYQYMDWYLIPKLLNRPYWTDPFFDEGAGNMIMCTYTHPIYDDNKNFIGVLTADLPMEWLTEKVNSIKPYKSSYNLMIGKGGSYIVHTNPDRILNETIFTATTDMVDTTVRHLGKEMIKGNTGMVTLQNDDTLSFVMYAPVPSSGWSLAMVLPLRDVYAGVIEMNTILIIVAVLALFLIAFLTHNVIKKISKPIGEFAVSARSIAKGNFNTPLPVVKSEDELFELRKSMDFMQTSLNTYITELKDTTSAKERIESELNIARQIQMGMIPKIFPPFPDRNDIDLFAMLRPAKEVGGDLYDFFIHDEKLFFAIGDVSGKGVPASLLMAVTRSLFRSVAATLEDPKLIVESINHAIGESNESNMFVTMFIGVLDLPSGHVKYCNAGHNPPCIISESGEVSFLDVIPNTPVGIFDHFEYTTQTVDIPHGSTAFLYTDGLTEAENPQKELYTEKRLMDVLKSHPSVDAESMLRIVLKSVEGHVNGAVQSDDLTMMVIRYHKVENAGELFDNRKLVINNQVSELHLLAGFIDKIGEELSLDAGLVMSLNLAMEEAVSNVIFYAYPDGETNHKIEIIFSKRGKEIYFSIIDSGVPFDPTAKKDADITLSAQEREIGGLGIFMVKKIMDSVVYSREGDKNILKMKKQI